MIRKSLAMAIFIGLFMGATTLHHGFGGLIAFIDMPSILLVIGCTASATFGLLNIQIYFQACMVRHHSV